MLAALVVLDAQVAVSVCHPRCRVVVACTDLLAPDAPARVILIYRALVSLAIAVANVGEITAYELKAVSHWTG